jgi:uncharacterized protein with FMN-binding domain
MTIRDRSGAGTTAAGLGVALVVASAVTTGTAAACSPSAPDAGPGQPRAPVPRDSTYRDGVYSDTGWYGGLPSSIAVTVTLVAGVITTVRVTPHATVPQSLYLQRRFAAAVPAVVVGRRIDEVNVGRLAGSSGTPRGFNDALRKIRAQARRDAQRPR